MAISGYLKRRLPRATGKLSGRDDTRRLRSTHKEGTILYPYERRETLGFAFNLNSLELSSYQIHDGSPKVIYGYNSCTCKTRFAGFKSHVLLCKTMRLAEKNVYFPTIKDDAEYYHWRDLPVRIKNFKEMMTNIKNFQKFLSSVGKRHGLQVKPGDEI